MSYEVLLNSTNISQFVVSYTREKEICDGIGRLELRISKELTNIKPWDVITIYENSNKVGTFFVSSITKSESGLFYSVSGQDGSKKLTDYFLSRKVTPKNTIKYTKELIQNVLNEAGVNYSFNVSGNGAPVAPETEYGLQSAYDAVLSFVQQSGWYFHFDKDNICRIGKLKASLSNVKYTFTDENTISFSYNYNDNSLRNRVVVWGGYDYNSNKDILFSKRVQTPFDRHKLDIRTIVLSNGAIHSLATARYLGNLILSEFTNLNKEQTIQAPGFLNLDVGDVVRIDLTYHKFTGIVTGLQVSAENSGIVTRLTINKRCPRIFGWFEWGTNPDYDDYVYVGTQGGGVKRKPIGKSGWSDFSSGLSNLVVKDLRIYGGNFICIADDGFAYRRTENTSWTKISHGSFYDSQGIEYTESQVRAVSCAIDQVSGDFYVGYNYYQPDTDYRTFRSWVACYDSGGRLKYKQPVELYFTNKLLIHDLDRHSANTFIAGIGDVSEFLQIGYRDVYPVNSPEITLPFIYGLQIYSTSGVTPIEKYEENSFLVPSGVYIYSGGFINTDARIVCSYIQENDFASTHTLYDNGRIFEIRHDSIYIYDFTVSGYTTRTGLPIKHTPIIISGLIPPMSYNNRFLYLDKKETYPELHLVLFDDLHGNSLFHAKYTFSDYSYLTISGSALLHFGDFITPELNIPYPYYKINNLWWNSGDKNPQIFCNNGVLLELVYVDFETVFGVYVVKYDLVSQLKSAKLAYSFTSDDVFPLFISKFYDIPDNSVLYGVFFVGCGGVGKTEILNGQCLEKVNAISTDVRIIYVYYKDDLIIRDDVLNSSSMVSKGSCNYRQSTDPNSDVEGNITWLLGLRPESDNNGVKCLGYKLSEYTEALFAVYYELTYQDFVYIPSVSNPCCYKVPSQHPDWTVRVLRGNFGCLVKNGTVEKIQTQTFPSDIRNLHCSPLVVPSGYPITRVEASSASRGYNFFLKKFDTGESVSIPIFQEWGLGVLDNTCPYIDFFDDTVYFFINAPWSNKATLYGVDFKTGISTKIVSNFFYDIPFGEKWSNVPPLIHNGILFRRGAFWKFNTTISGYFAFPILYQNSVNTNIINIELLPTNVEVSKSFPYVTYNPFEYWLPNVSGSLVNFNTSTATKIYSIDFTSYISSSKSGNDERVFDCLVQDILESGIIRDEDFRFIAIPEENILYTRDVEFNNDFSIIKTTSSTIYHIETSNLPEKPFIFISQENPPQFYEYDKNTWRIFSSPSYKILTIRVDDLL